MPFASPAPLTRGFTLVETAQPSAGPIWAKRGLSHWEIPVFTVASDAAHYAQWMHDLLADDGLEFPALTVTPVVFDEVGAARFPALGVTWSRAQLADRCPPPDHDDDILRASVSAAV